MNEVICYVDELPRKLFIFSHDITLRSMRAKVANAIRRKKAPTFIVIVVGMLNMVNGVMVNVKFIKVSPARVKLTKSAVRSKLMICLLQLIGIQAPPNRIAVILNHMCAMEMADWLWNFSYIAPRASPARVAVM
ncbi:MAG: hypothetical protein ACUVTE_06790, partial [Candidatus Bathycorpusculaceae bacterium]